MAELSTPVLNPIGDRFRLSRPDTGDPRAISRGLETTVEAGKTFYEESNKRNLVDEMEAEKENFLSGKQDLATETADEAISALTGSFADPTNPTQEEVSAFSNKMRKLVSAKASGGISTTEFQIRSEKILREHMAKAPWAADDLVRTAQMTQGWNPIGSELEAASKAQETSNKAQKELYDQVVQQMIQAGVPAWKLVADFEGFMKDGVSMTSDLQNLAGLQVVDNMGKTHDNIDRREATRIFNYRVSKGVTAILPGVVQDYQRRWTSDMESGALVNNPALEKMYSDELASIKLKYGSGGSAERDILAKLSKLFPNLDQEDIRKQYASRVDPLFSAMSKAGDPGEMRAAVEFYSTGEWRKLMADNPQLQVTVGLMKAAAAFANTPAMQQRGWALTDSFIDQISPMLSAPVVTTPDGNYHVPPEVLDGRIGVEDDRAGNPQRADQSRLAAVRMGGELLKSEDGIDATNGVGMMIGAATSFGRARDMKYSRPSAESRQQFLGTIADEEFPVRFERADPRIKYTAQTALNKEIEKQGTDLIADMDQKIGQTGNKDWVRNVSFVSSGGRIIAEPREELDRNSSDWRFADQTARIINSQLGAELSLFARARMGLAKTDGKYAPNPELVYEDTARLLNIENERRR